MWEKIPATKQIMAGPCAKVEATKGPITEGKLTKLAKFGTKIASHLTVPA